MDEHVRAQIRRAATIYDTAAAAGRAPTAAVARQLDLPRSTAARRVKAARDLGLLPAATLRRVTANTTTGPHRAVTAEVNRGTPDSFKVRICATCITRWPCAENR